MIARGRWGRRLETPEWAQGARLVRPNLAEATRRRLAEQDETRSTLFGAKEAATAVALAEARRRGPGAGQRKGAPGHGTGRIGSVMRLPVHTAPSRMLKAVYPWITDPGLGVPGAYIGADLHSMASFLFDPWELYQRELITSPNIALIGVLGSGKSALQKCLILRLLVFGVRFSWVQVKPEYNALCAELGIEPLRCGPGQLVRFNPLAEVRRHPDQSRAEWLDGNRARRLRLVQGILAVLLGRPLQSMEKSVLGWALDEVTGADNPTRDEPAPVSLPTLLETLVDSSRWADRAKAVGVTVEQAMHEARAVRLELSELVYGSLRGMFDSTDPRNRSFDLRAPGTLLDLSAVRGNDVLTVLAMVCGQSAMEAELMHPDAGRRICGYDEAWKAMQYVDLVRRMQEQWKLARLFGIANLVAYHRYSDLKAVGNQGSEARELAYGLLEDSGVKIAYRQDEAGLALTQQLNGLSAVERDLLRYLRVGVGLWKIGQDRSFVVKHLLTPLEVPLVDTDSRMEVVPGVDDLPEGDWEDRLETWAAAAGQ